jgi:hypothetical protein
LLLLGLLLGFGLWLNLGLQFGVLRVDWVLLDSKRFFNPFLNRRQIKTIPIFHFIQIPNPQIRIASNSLNFDNLLLPHTHPRKDNFIIPPPDKSLMHEYAITQPRYIIVGGLVLVEGVFADELFTAVRK